MAAEHAASHEPIAIVGSACRFAGAASSPSKLWEILQRPPDLLRGIPKDRFDADKFYHHDSQHRGASNVRHSYTLSENVRAFDAQFFGISPLEATAMDPSQRMLLEVTYEALEAAGIPMEDLKDSLTGVFVGVMGDEYSSVAGRDTQSIPTYFASGAARSLLSNRLSYFFDLRGPSMTIDTACSSSLVALHQAVQSLRSGESTLAIVAGANLLLGPEPYIAESNLRMLSPTGRSRMWDDAANGYARADGFGVLVLTTVSQAIEMRHHVETIVRETGINQDGRTNGITMPSSEAQTELIQMTYKKAGLNLTNPLDRPQYFEAHGTGTPAGDPIEAKAINDAFFGSQTPKWDSKATGPLYVGSIKTVLGHTEGTAGIAGLMKASLAIQHGVIPPNLLLDRLSEKVRPFCEHVTILKVPQTWPQLPCNIPKRASVNSFGFGGTNAHAILEDCSGLTTELRATTISAPMPLIPFNFSAASQISLRTILSEHMTYIKDNPGLSPRDYLWTLNNRRSTHLIRVSIAAFDLADLANKLERTSTESNDANGIENHGKNVSAPRLVGIFTGQGSQWAGMGAKLLKMSATARSCVEKMQISLNTLRKEHAPCWKLMDELIEANAERISQPEFSQPLCTAIQIAIVDLIRAARINLVAVVGHSSGEIAAAYAAGYLSAECAIRIAYYRGFFANRSHSTQRAPGLMLAVGTSFADASDLCELPLFKGRICVAAINSRTSVTLSGDAEAIQQAEVVMGDEKRFARVLRVDKAYHSHHMGPVMEHYVQALMDCNIQVQTPSPDSELPRWISSVTGSFIDSISLEMLGGEYWALNMAQTVLFSSALEFAVGACGPFDAAIEIGPHPVLEKPALETIRDVLGGDILYCSTLRRDTNDVDAMASTFGTLWKALGRMAVDFNALFDRLSVPGDAPAKLLKGLPTYAWTHERDYWHETRQTRASRIDPSKPHGLIGTMTPNRTATECQWRNYLSPKRLPWLLDHKIQGQTVFPAAGYISAVTEALRQLYSVEDIKHVEFNNLNIGRALFIPEDVEVEIVLNISIFGYTEGRLEANFTFNSDAGQGSMSLDTNASGELNILIAPAYIETLPSPAMSEDRYVEVEDEVFYDFVGELGYGYSGAFRGLTRLRSRLNEATGLISVPKMPNEAEERLLVQPGILDSAIQGILLAHSFPGDHELRHIHLPVWIERLQIDIDAMRLVDNGLHCRLAFQASTIPQQGGIVGDVVICFQENCGTLVQLEGLRVKPLIAYSSQDDAKIFFETVWGYETPLLDQTADMPQPVAYQDCYCSPENMTSQYLDDMANVATQISHRFPHMTVLDVGAGLLPTILKRDLGDKFVSYTVTEPTVTFTGTSKEAIQRSKASLETRFKQLDLNKPVDDQDHQQASYDLLVACLELDTVENLENVFSYFRKLLKTGGYLISLACSDASFSTVETMVDGNLGPYYEMGGVRHPRHVPIRDWHSLLHDAGFLVIDTKVQDGGKTSPLSLALCQATDDRTQPLFNPLEQPRFSLPRQSSLTILGDENMSLPLADAIGSHYAECHRFDHFDDMASVDIAFGTIVSFADCGAGSVFHNPTGTTLKALQNILKHSRVLLWVTTEAHATTQHKSMILGLLRTAVMEMKYLVTQTISFITPEEIDTSCISKRLIQLEVGAYMKETQADENILWTIEPEVRVRGGRILIPRLRVREDQNTRYSALRRPVARKTRASDTAVSITRTDGILGISSDTISPVPGPHVHCLRYSLTKSVLVHGQTRAFLSLSENDRKGDYSVVLTSSLASRVKVHQSWTIPAPRAEKGIYALISLYIQLLAESIVSKAQSGQPAVILGADVLIRDTIASLAAERGIRLRILSTERTDNSRYHTYLAPHAPKSSISQALPANTATFINMGPPTKLSSLVESLLPDHCQKLASTYFVCDFSEIETDTRCIDEIGRRLEAARIASLSMERLTEYAAKIPKVSLSNYVGQTSLSQAILSWNTREQFEISVLPASQMVQFAVDKTYWLLGLTGGLGQSLCRWMADRGALNIALTSRNTRPDETWHRSLLQSGCCIRTFPADITNRQSLQNAYSTITKAMPPIAGVVQGAAVFHDTAFTELDLERLCKVTKPKVEGSVWLDELFPSDTLDFMLFLSSVAYITGNAGQSAYAMANSFMAALAANRRSRGLSASVVNVGAILGNGYVSRKMSRAKQLGMERSGFEFLSERAFHEIFAEGILASSCSPEDDFEITTGLRLQWGEKDSPVWSANPIFSYLVPQAGHKGGRTRHRSMDTSLKATLAQVLDDDDQAIRILQGSFIAHLQATLQIEANVSVVSSLNALGVDSLVAVDLQSWFRTELGVEISILEMFKPRPIQDLLHAVKKHLIINRSKLPSSGVPANNPRPSSDERKSIEDQPSHPNQTTSSDISAAGIPGRGPMSLFPSVSCAATNGSHHDGSVNFERTVPLSFAQARFWFLTKSVGDKCAFNIVVKIMLKGQINISRLREAFTAVGQRHEALRTVFYNDEVTKKPMQGIIARSMMELEHSEVDSIDCINESIQEMKHHGFDLERGPLLRVKFLSFPEEKSYMVVAYHHIVMDGIGFEIFCDDLERCYNGDPGPRGEGMSQYPDYTLREVHNYERGAWAKQLDYWHANFRTLPQPIPILPLSARPFRPERSSFTSRGIQFRISQDLKHRIEERCNGLGVKPFHFYLTAFATLVFRYSDNRLEEICIGVADGNRKEVDSLSSLGLYLNLLPLRVSTNPDHPFTRFLRHVQDNSDDAFYKYQVPFELLLDQLSVPRSASFSPLFQLFFNYRSNIKESRTFLGCEADGESMTVGQSTYDLALDVLDSNGREDLITLSVSNDLYNVQHANLLKNSYLSLLQTFSRNPATRIASPLLHDEQDVQNAIRLGQGTELSSRWQGTIADRIDQMSQQYGENCALTDTERHSLTYTEMTQRVRKISSNLAQRDINTLHRVCILQRPGIDWICSLLATLRLGKVAVPLDSQLGADRLRAILHECHPSVILVDESTQVQAELSCETGVETICVSHIKPRSNVCSLRFAAKTDDPAVIVYTSGSTGKPKGIPISHSSICNFVEFGVLNWGLTEGDGVVLQQSSYAFDMSLCQIFVCLGHGNTLLIPHPEMRGDPAAISSLLIERGVTVTLATPTEYISWLEGSRMKSFLHSRWRVAISGGESFSESLLRRFQSLQPLKLRLVNCYGPAETTFACADCVISNTEIPCHIPPLTTLPNYRIQILDRHLAPVPTGVPGRVAIGGAGTASGYLADEARTIMAFLPRRVTDNQSFEVQNRTTMYLSDDQGRLDSAGRLLLEGRIDGSTQVKIGGIRIDLEEIESSILSAFPQKIQQAIVSNQAGESPLEPDFLVAFVVLSADALHEDETSLAIEIQRKLPLPQYMRPSVVKLMEEIPKTSSGKVDRNSLKAVSIIPQKLSENGSIVLDLSESEETLQALWREALPRRALDIAKGTDFFHAGGNSLALMKLQGLIEERLGVQVSIHDMFQSITLENMSRLIRKGQRLRHQPVLRDWQEETAISAELAVLAASSGGKRPEMNPRTIVMTGATGFLGRQILRLLIDDGRVSKIICIAVRQEQDLLPSVFHHQKVELWHGDLGAPRLGLPKDASGRIFSDADVVVHVAADVSFRKTFESLKLTNVASTQELVRLSLPRRIPLHFVSSASVAQLSGQQAFGPESVAGFPPSGDHIEGYTAAKWVCEVYLERVHQDFGLPITVHRPSSITGEGAPNSDLVGSLMAYTRGLKAVPNTESWSGYLDFVPVEAVADQIVGHFMAFQSCRHVGVRFVYEAGSTVIRVKDIRTVLESETGQPFRLLPVEEWMNTAVKAGMNTLLAEHLRYVLTQKALLPRILREGVATIK